MMSAATKTTPEKPNTRTHTTKNMGTFDVTHSDMARTQKYAFVKAYITGRHGITTTMARVSREILRLWSYAVFDLTWAMGLSDKNGSEFGEHNSFGNICKYATHWIFDFAS